MSVRDFLIGFTIGWLATALACIYVFLKAYVKAVNEQVEQIKK